MTLQKPQNTQEAIKQAASMSEVVRQRLAS